MRLKVKVKGSYWVKNVQNLLSWLDVSSGVILIQCPGLPSPGQAQGLPGDSCIHARVVLGIPETGAGRVLVVLQPERRTWKGLSPPAEWKRLRHWHPMEPSSDLSSASH